VCVKKITELTDCNVFFNQVFTLSQTIMKFVINFSFWTWCSGIPETGLALAHVSHCSRCLSCQAFSIFTTPDLPFNLYSEAGL